MFVYAAMCNFKTLAGSKSVITNNTRMVGNLLALKC